MSLNKVLANYAVYYQKLRNYHWNVTGAQFFALHQKFEEMYTETAETVDEIAERILSKGERPLSTLKEFLDNATLVEDSKPADDKAMVEDIIKDLEMLTAQLRQEVEGLDDDPATLNLLEGLADAQEKTMWMLRSLLK